MTHREKFGVSWRAAVVSKVIASGVFALPAHVAELSILNLSRNQMLAIGNDDGFSV